jgi:hypothetical protein
VATVGKHARAPAGSGSNLSRGPLCRHPPPCRELRVCRPAIALSQIQQRAGQPPDGCRGGLARAVPPNRGSVMLDYVCASCGSGPGVEFRARDQARREEGSLSLRGQRVDVESWTTFTAERKWRPFTMSVAATD